MLQTSSKVQRALTKQRFTSLLYNKTKHLGLGIRSHAYLLKVEENNIRQM